jgi:hypothetical protein
MQTKLPRMEGPKMLCTPGTALYILRERLKCLTRGRTTRQLVAANGGHLLLHAPDLVWLTHVVCH